MATPAFADPGKANLPDYLIFLNQSVQIPPSALPADSPWPGYALSQAEALVIRPNCSIPGIVPTLATYNCATAILIAICPDQPNSTYFANLRSSNGYDLIAPSTGLVTSASDQGTSGAVKVPDWVAGLTIDQFGFMKTPWGREYLAYQQKYGPTIWVLR